MNTEGASVYARHTDGTLLFAAADMVKPVEEEVRAVLARAWNIEVLPFAKLCPLDFYAVRDARLVGVMELKTRNVASTQYTEVFLSVRKWLALLMASTGMGCPGVFIVKFTDCVKFINVAEIDATALRIGGNSRMLSPTDIEPMILVPVQAMTFVREAP